MSSFYHQFTSNLTEMSSIVWIRTIEITELNQYQEAPCDRKYYDSFLSLLPFSAPCSSCSLSVFGTIAPKTSKALDSRGIVYLCPDLVINKEAAWRNDESQRQFDSHTRHPEWAGRCDEEGRWELCSGSTWQDAGNRKQHIKLKNTLLIPLCF